MKWTALIGSASLVFLGCSSSTSSPAPGATDASPDVAAPNDASADAANPDAASSLAPCPNDSAYQAGTTIQFGGATGFAFAPPCLKVAPGASVTWQGDFTVHPLSPSTRGTSPNPIPATATGTTVSVTFPTAGRYPYFCTNHGTDQGTGMAGVVWVAP